MHWWQQLITHSVAVLLGIFSHWLGVRSGNGQPSPPAEGGGA